MTISRPFFIFITIVVCVIALDIYSNAYVSPNVNIHKQDIIHYSEFHRLINSKYPIIVRDVHDQLPLLFIENNMTGVSYISNLFSPLSVSSHIQYLPEDHIIRTTLHNRTFIIQTKGTSTIWLFHPNQSSLLSIRGKQNGHMISTIDTDDAAVNDKWPLFKHSSYIEIKIVEGMLVSIPTNWSYTHVGAVDTSSKQLLATSNTLGSIIRYFLR